MAVKRRGSLKRLPGLRKRGPSGKGREPMTVSIAVLSERAVLAVEGAEVRDFLHSLLTCDLLPLETGEAAYGALLTPQGKILFDLFAVATERGFGTWRTQSCSATRGRKASAIEPSRRSRRSRRPLIPIPGITMRTASGSAYRTPTATSAQAPSSRTRPISTSFTA